MSECKFWIKTNQEGKDEEYIVLDMVEFEGDTYICAIKEGNENQCIYFKIKGEVDTEFEVVNDKRVYKAVKRIVREKFLNERASQ